MAVDTGGKVLENIDIDSDTRIVEGSLVVKDLECELTADDIPWEVIHQSGARIELLNYRALPGSNGKILMSLMDRMEYLEIKTGEIKSFKNDTSEQRWLSENIKDGKIIYQFGDKV